MKASSLFGAIRYRTLLVCDLKQFLHHPRSLHLLPLMAGGIFLVNWIAPVGPATAVIVLVVVLGMEPQWNSILYRVPNELPALGMFPLSWRAVVITKNVSTAMLAALLTIPVGIVLLYFSPSLPGSSAIRDGALYAATVVFPLLQTGNWQSIHEPRRLAGFQKDDAIELFWMIVNLGVISFPYALISVLGDYTLAYLIYAAGTGVFWYRVSIPRTANHIEQHFASLCSRV